MRKPQSVESLERLGRVRLSDNFFMRDFLHSEISAFHGIQNIPDDPDLAVEAGTQLCQQLLEPLQGTFGRIAIRSAYRSCEVNEYGNQHGHNCGSNESNYADHIWDRRDGEGFMGATACIVIPWFVDQYESGSDWRSLAWWMHDHLPYDTLYFFPKLAACNIQWREQQTRRIDSYIKPKGCLTKPGMEGHTGGHEEWYQGFPLLD